MTTEADVAAAAKDWLLGEGWSVYDEVTLLPNLQDSHELGTARADLVVTRGEQVGVVEAKLGLTIALFLQAHRWTPFADAVWIAVPDGKFTDERREAYKLAREWYHVGVLTVGDEGVVERVRPPVGQRRRDDAILASLDPEHKTHAAAGTNRGGQFTPFARTKDALVKYVLENPRCTLAEALAVTGHHYRTMDQAIEQTTKAIRKGLVPGVKFGWRQRLEAVQ